MRKYFIVDGIQRKGPFTIHELKAMSITKNTLVWFLEILDPKPAGEIDEISEIFSEVNLNSVERANEQSVFIEKTLIDSEKKQKTSSSDTFNQKSKTDISENNAVEEEQIRSKTELLKLKLADCNLSVRALNSLKSAGFNTIGDLISQPKDYLLKFRNMGKKSYSEIIDLVEKLGLKFS